MTAPSLQIITWNLWVSAPVCALAASAMVTLIAGAFWPAFARWLTPCLALGGIALTAAFTILAGMLGLPPAGMQVMDSFTVVFDLIILIAAFITVLVSNHYVTRENLERGEYYALMMLSASGAMLMAASDNYVMMFLGLELLSIPLYVLAGFSRGRSESQESALKYLLLGAFASAFFVFGAALVFSATGSTNIVVAGDATERALMGTTPIYVIGLAMILTALAFKVALVPFHMWTPDVYQGAPTSVTAFMAVVAKAAGFGALARVAAAGPEGSWTVLLWGLSAATMIWGNLLAISQNNIKRLLAYSSIAHAGYLLMGILAGGRAGISAVLFYLLTYAAMTFGAFAAVIILAGRGDGAEDIEDYRGIARRSPLLGWTMAIFMFSLAGLPPFAGFFGKLYLFSAAVDAGYPGLTVLAVLTSVMGVFYYLRVTVAMWMQEPEAESGPAAQTSAPLLSRLVPSALAIAVLALGIFSSPVLRWTNSGSGGLERSAETAIQMTLPEPTNAPAALAGGSR